MIFMIKFLDKADYVRDLLDGNIFANRLAWFKRTEEGDTSARQDPHEGTIAWHQHDQIDLIINDIDMTPDLVGPVQIQSSQLDHLNIFCTYAGHLNDSELEGLSGGELPENLLSQLVIPQRCYSLGQYAVVVTDIPEFIRRIGRAARSEGYRMWYGRVKYYDPDTYHGDFSAIEAVFSKQQHHRFQSEFRFVLSTSTLGDEPITLEIGDIRDITLQFLTSELNTKYLGLT